MDASLLDRLDACCVFVVGKGGVGKTTTAGALALALADRGLATHLISTDPAHSLGDVFGIDAAGGAAIAGVCSTPLTIEEFSADGYVRGPFRGLVEGLAELAERGTYLEEAEVRTFVDLQLPGVDEVMAALRLAELADSAARVVVDTAPTGHTLRLLDAGAVVGSWVAAFRAMAEKASVVASRLVRRPVRLTGEAAVDALEEAVGRFERAVLGRAAFVVVGTGEPAVEAETGRLIAGLERRGLRVALRVHRGAGAPAGAVAMPAAASPRGCAALRELAGALRTGPAAALRTGPAAAWKAPAPGRVRPGDGADGGPLLPVFRRELLFFVGKGGVGKSTCAAASALALAAERPVALCGVDPAGSLGDVLGIEPSSGGREVVPGLLVRQVDAGAELARLREEYRRDVAVLFERFGLDEAAALDRRVVEAFWNLAPPGLDELLALATLLDAAGTDRTLVVDAAPTGHFLRLMEMPDVALEWVHASMRLLLRHRAITGLDGVAERLLRLARELRALRDRLVDPTRTGVYVVTLDEPLVRRETERLRAALGRAGLPEAAVIRNRVDGGGEAPAAADGITIAAPLLSPPPGGPDALRDFFARWGPT